MIVAVPRESFPGERRVALTPAGAVKLAEKAGAACRVEAGAGAEAGFPDAAYREAGAGVVADRAELLGVADLVLQVRTLGANPAASPAELDHYKAGAVVVGVGDPLDNPAAAAEYASRNLTLFAMDLLPRISRAQGMDVLSSMATVAGYKAVLLAANESPQLFPLLMTAAGTLAPAKVLVIGAGVAGLQAIATARRLGAVVRAYDIRPAAREQIESVGASVVDLGLDASDAEDGAGYAKQATSEHLQRQREALARVVADCNVVITTAAVPGRRPPMLISADAVAGMPPGAVVIDLAADRGGNCEVSRPDEIVINHGARVLGPTNLASTAPLHASQMYSNNMVNFAMLLARDARLAIDTGDEIVRGTLVTSEGRVVNDRVRGMLADAAPA